MEYRIDIQWQDRTIKEYLYTVVGVSRSVLTRLKKREDGILLNGQHVTVRAQLNAGDILSLAMDDVGDSRAELILPRKLPFTVVYEDDYILVAGKGAFMPTHPTHGHYEDTLANALMYYMQEKGVSDFVFRAVNRLDRDTSGLVVIAKDQLSCAKLSKSLQEGKIEKTYLALLDGRVEGDGGLIDKPICRVSDSIITRRCCNEGEGASALTRYFVLQRCENYTIVAARPITGRTHQLRVHFASIGHPILGDTLYGKASDVLNRQALHAVSLHFPHPREEKKISVVCKPPEDMLAFIKEYENIENFILQNIILD